jgi:thiosulfate/3-mercaptopyruvate sulfurtransferase
MGGFMSENGKARSRREFLAGLGTLPTFAAYLACIPVVSAANPPSDPWSASQLVDPADFARELAADHKGAPLTTVYVGFRTLYEGGHISGASFHGTASTERGLASLKKWATTIPHSTNLVIYCGCCPFDRCPNIRPAFAELRDMGFTHLRVVTMPTSFAEDWAGKRYPIEKGI